MKAVYTLALILALAGGHSVSAQTQKPEKGYAVSQPETEPVEITAYGNRLKVENAPVGSVLEIYSVVGIKVKQIEMKQPSGEYVVDIAKGYYIIRIGDTVRKVAIR